MKVIILGSSGRAHALVKACLNSPKVQTTICAPGNPGIELECTCAPLNLESTKDVLAFAQEQAPSLIIVSQEQAQYNGVVDILQEHGFLVFGASKHAFQLEAHKSDAKDFMHRYDIPTAHAAQFETVADALECLEGEHYPTVIKADTHARGHGVFIVNNFEEGKKRVIEILEEQKLGKSKHVLIEEYMKGEEIALMLLVCGEKFILMPTAHDYTKLDDGDQGPNTPGMGAHIPSDLVSDAVKENIEESIIKPTLRGLRQEGIDYHNALYIGIMLTPRGPKVIDYKMRFGDPQCQALLPLFESDPIEAIYQCAKGILKPQDVKFKDLSSVILIKTAQGYPDNCKMGEVIKTHEPLPENCQIVYAGVDKNAEEELITAGARVLGVLALKPTLPEAALAAYDLARKVTFESEHYRQDIAVSQIERIVI